MDPRQRFTLRYEYFGGILHDKQAVRAEPIPQYEWNLLLGVEANETGKKALCDALQKPENEKLRRFVDHWEELGVLDRDLNLHADIYKAPYPLVWGALCAPLRTYLHITDGCNLRCTHCMFACTEKFDDEMTTEEVFKALGILKEMRCPELRITGGEPTTRKDLFDVIRKAKELGLYVMLNTNGVFSETIRHKCLDAGLDEIIISIEGDEEENEKRRGKGSLGKVLKTIRFLAEHKCTKLTLNQTFGRSNVKDLPYVVRLACQYGANVNLMPLRPYGTTRVTLMEDMLTPEEFMRFTEDVMRLRESSQVRDTGIKIIHRNFDLFVDPLQDDFAPAPFDRSSCGAAGLGLGLNPDGRLNVCGFLSKIPQFQGPNILTSSFYDLWFSPSLHAFRTVIKRYCESCKYYRKQCVGACKAMAYAKHNDLGGMDPYCFAHLIKD